MQITIDKATIEFLEGPVAFAAKPSQPFEGAPAEQSGSVQKFRVTTLDTLNVVFGIVQWPQATAEVRVLDFIDGLEKYERLIRAGKMMLLPQPGGLALAELNVMRLNDKKYFTLHGTTYSELNALAKTDASQAILEAGAKGVGTREQLVNDQTRQANRISMLVSPSAKEAIALAFTITRVLAIMNDLGQDS